MTHKDRYSLRFSSVRMGADLCNLHSIAYNTYVEQISVPSQAFLFLS